jgi:hypothetical protein
MDGVVDLTQALHEYGPALVITAALLLLNAFFIWRDYKRESIQQREVERLHEIHSTIVLPLLGDCKAAISANTEIIRQNSQIINSWINNGPR